jgi:hypothetical protein
VPFALHIGFSSFNVVAVVWSLWLVYDATYLSFLNPTNLIPALFFSAFQLVYAIEVVRYCCGQTSMKTTLTWGVISQIPIMGLGALNWIAPNIIYSGPFPLLILLGYLIMRRYGPEEPTTPWD